MAYQNNKGRQAASNRPAPAVLGALKKGDMLRITTPSEYKDKVTGEDKVFWTEIGTAFIGEKGINLELKALPVGNRMVLFPHTEQSAA